MVCAVTAAAAGQSRPQAPTIDTLAGGVLRVRNHAPTGWTGAASRHMVLERTILSNEGVSLLAQPDQLAVASGGEIVVHDLKQPGLLVFAPDGRFLRSIGNRGAGPGEFSAFARIAVRGDTVAVLDEGRAITWRTNGTLLAQWRTDPCSCSTSPVLDGRGGVLAPVRVERSGTRQLAMVRWTFNGMAHDTTFLPAPESEKAWLRLRDGSMVHLPFGAIGAGVFDVRRRYVYGNASQYHLIVLRPNEDSIQVIEMPGARRPVSPSLRDSAYRKLMASPMVSPVLHQSDLASVWPYFISLNLDSEDRLWLGRPTEAGTIDAFDVLAADGRWLGTVRAPDGAALPFTNMVFTGGRMYRLAENEDGEPVIQVFRIVMP
jgi:hypothetical protein